MIVGVGRVLLAMAVVVDGMHPLIVASVLAIALLLRPTFLRPLGIIRYELLPVIGCWALAFDWCWVGTGPWLLPSWRSREVVQEYEAWSGRLGCVPPCHLSASDCWWVHAIVLPRESDAGDEADAVPAAPLLPECCGSGVVAQAASAGPFARPAGHLVAWSLPRGQGDYEVAWYYSSYQVTWYQGGYDLTRGVPYDLVPAGGCKATRARWCGGVLAVCCYPATTHLRPVPLPLVGWLVPECASLHHSLWAWTTRHGPFRQPRQPVCHPSHQAQARHAGCYGPWSRAIHCCLRVHA